MRGDATDVGADGDREARAPGGAGFQPWLLAGAALAVAAGMVAASASPVVLAMVVICAGTGTGVWVAERAGRLDSGARHRATLVLAATAVGTLVVVLQVGGGEQPETYLVLAAALSMALAAVRDARIRWPMQAVVVGAVLVSLLAAGDPLPAVALAVALLLGTAVLAGSFVGLMRSAREAALRAGAEAMSRAELLDAVQRLPGSSVEEASLVVCRTLRSLGFEGAGVDRVQDGTLVRIGRLGSVPDGDPVPPGEGPGWTAIECGRTIVSRDPATPSEPATRRPVTRARIVAPVRVDGVPTAVLIGDGRQGRALTAEDVEVVELLASHLGGVVGSEVRLARQGELLERMGVLDRLRGGLLGAVSDEVRDPLTILRGAGQILATHAGRISEEQRVVFLERMCTQAADLRDLVDVLLDFSRSQAQREAPVVRPVGLEELLRPLHAASHARVVPPPSELAGQDLMVLVDPSLVRSAVELLVALQPSTDGPGAVTVVVGSEKTELRIAASDRSPASDLGRSLAAQLLEAGGAQLDVEDGIVVRLERAPSTLTESRDDAVDAVMGHS